MFERISWFFDDHPIIRFLVILLVLGLAVTVIISCLEAFGLVGQDRLIVTEFMDKIMDIGMDGSGWGLLAIPKNIVLLVPRYLYGWAEDSIVTVVKAGASFYHHPIRSIFALIVAIITLIVLFILIYSIAFIFIDTFGKKGRAEREEYQKILSERVDVVDMPFKSWTFTGKTFEGKPVEGFYKSKQGYKIKLSGGIYGNRKIHNSLDNVLECPFGTYKGGLTFDEDLQFWVPNGEGTLSLKDGRTAMGEWKYGRLPYGKIKYPNPEIPKGKDFVIPCYNLRYQGKLKNLIPFEKGIIEYISDARFYADGTNNVEVWGISNISPYSERKFELLFQNNQIVGVKERLWGSAETQWVIITNDHPWFRFQNKEEEERFQLGRKHFEPVIFAKPVSFFGMD